MADASVLGWPIISVFPQFNDMADEASLHYYYNRMIFPRNEEDRSNLKVVIMWIKASPFSQSSLASHFVPVIQ